MIEQLRCIIVDDHPAILFALRLTLEANGIKVIDECANGEDALKKIRNLQPDIVVLDLDLPRVDGITLLQRLRKNKMPCKVIVLSAIDNDMLASQIRNLGGNGYIHKSESLEKLPQIIKWIMAGYVYFTERVICQDTSTLFEQLSERELVVFRKLARGQTNGEIAADLSLSPKTISTYKMRLFEKLNIKTLIELYEMAKREGI
ncbi:response regulator transcription factor [Vibrio cholerae]|uniref:response regulator transcription factor n=3 Tax=Vibrio cholerae TaxID=666 RepID=UPI000321CFC9|nr:response regulator transcription factor [Vibrio cholerae]EJL6306980.1 response regulator transcription factor [Vibrio cholerae]EJL6586805.1 response regulator transcription factor [Vibrio cholerae]EJL6702842.1 response regulator transcription factor [Vibrio cholerae]EKF9440692.1 response regulator transcription factor [Vibrio cholerae]EKF9740506.1 response regulator transcription factor [Vibrio cholerae]